MSLLEKKLTREWALKVIPPEKRMFGAILYDLQAMGKTLARELRLRDYGSFEEFLEEHARGESPFAMLEGRSEVERTAEGNLFVLKDCPTEGLLASLRGPDGALPEIYPEIVEKYKSLFSAKGAVLHPFCILHQMVRAQAAEGMKVGGMPMLVYQVSCRDKETGKIVYATEGTRRAGLSKDEIAEKIGGGACMYLVRS